MRQPGRFCVTPRCRCKLPAPADLPHIVQVCAAAWAQALPAIPPTGGSSWADLALKRSPLLGRKVCSQPCGPSLVAHAGLFAPCFASAPLQRLPLHASLVHALAWAARRGRHHARSPDSLPCRLQTSLPNRLNLDSPNFDCCPPCRLSRQPSKCTQLARWRKSTQTDA